MKISQKPRQKFLVPSAAPTKRSHTVGHVDRPRSSADTPIGSADKTRGATAGSVKSVCIPCEIETLGFSAMPSHSLCVRNLEAGYGDIQVLWGVDIDVAAASVVSIVGSNGAGKSTLLLAISGMVMPRAGSITYAGEDVTGMSPRMLVERGISHVPEGRRLFKALSVRDNLLLGAFQRKERSAVMRDLDFVFSVFPILHERASQDATTLSGGEQQMCAIGRGLMARPSLLIIDELSLGLAPSAVELLAKSVAKFKAEGISILLVEQDVMTAFEISDYGYVLEAGRVAAHGRPDELLQLGKIRDSYLGM